MTVGPIWGGVFTAPQVSAHTQLGQIPRPPVVTSEHCTVGRPPTPNATTDEPATPADCHIAGSLRGAANMASGKHRVHTARNHARNRRLQRTVWNDPTWRTYTRPTVRDRADGLCELCGNEGTIADHWPIPCLELLLHQGRRAALNPDNCRWLCHRCSGREDGRLAAQGPAIDRARAHTKGGDHHNAPHPDPSEVGSSLPAPKQSREW